MRILSLVNVPRAIRNDLENYISESFHPFQLWSRSTVAMLYSMTLLMSLDEISNTASDYKQTIDVIKSIYFFRGRRSPHEIFIETQYLALTEESSRGGSFQQSLPGNLSKLPQIDQFLTPYTFFFENSFHHNQINDVTSQFC